MANWPCREPVRLADSIGFAKRSEHERIWPQTLLADLKIMDAGEHEANLAFAAGAMLYVISHEIIPETHRCGHQKKATFGLAMGLVIMLFLDVWLG